jgi:hypothetical protein
VPSLLPAEDSKYKARRTSLNLQHPQPRPSRYQAALEPQAQNFDSPISPKSADSGSSTSLKRLPQQPALEPEYTDDSRQTKVEDVSELKDADSTLLKPQLSGKSGDAYQFKPYTSKSSINNPNFFETVNDAIKRLIST